MTWTAYPDPSFGAVLEEFSDKNKLSKGGVDLGQITALSNPYLWRGQSFVADRDFTANYVAFRLGKYSRLPFDGSSVQGMNDVTVVGTVTPKIYSLDENGDLDSLIVEGPAVALSEILTIDATVINFLPFVDLFFNAVELTEGQSYLARIDASIEDPDDGYERYIWLGRAATEDSDHSGQQYHQQEGGSVSSAFSQDIQFIVGNKALTAWIDDTTSWVP